MIKALENFDLVIFGGDGDLSLRKIIPAVINRIKDGQIKKYNKNYITWINYGHEIMTNKRKMFPKILAEDYLNVKAEQGRGQPLPDVN